MFRYTIAVVGLGVWLLPVRAHSADPVSDWRGVRVLPKEHAVIKVGVEVIDSSKWSIPYVVQDVNGEWFWIGDRRKGWVKRSQVVTLDEAAAYYGALIQSDPNNAWAYNLRATAYKEKGQLDQAIADYGQRLRLQSDAAGYNNRGNVWDRKQEYDKALADYSQAIELDTNNAVAYNNRGNTWRAKQKYDKALADYDQALRLDPNYADAYCNRGYAWDKKKDYAKAIADYDRAKKLDPNLADAYNAPAWIMATCADASHRDGVQAVKLATKACELAGWRDANYLDTLAAAHAESGDFESALKHLNKALALDAKNPLLQEHLKLLQDKMPIRE